MTQIARNDDGQPRVSPDSELITRLPATGTYFVRVEDLNGAGRASFTYELGRVHPARVDDADRARLHPRPAPRGDVDYLRVDAGPSDVVSVFCGSRTAGSGIQDLMAEVTSADGVTVLGTGTDRYRDRDPPGRGGRGSEPG